jgi:hypothetical protein
VAGLRCLAAACTIIVPVDIPFVNQGYLRTRCIAIDLFYYIDLGNSTFVLCVAKENSPTKCIERRTLHHRKHPRNNYRISPD